MANIMDILRERSQNIKNGNGHRVTNPKVPTKVERDTAVFAARQKPMPNFKFGTGSISEQLRERAKNVPSSSMNYVDPAFNHGNGSNKVDLDAFDAQFNAFMAKMKAAKAKKKQEAEKARLGKDET